MGKYIIKLIGFVAREAPPEADKADDEYFIEAGEQDIPCKTLKNLGIGYWAVFPLPRLTRLKLH